MIQLKKILASFLKSESIGGFIRYIHSNRIPFYGKHIYTDTAEISNAIISALYFRMYESAEIRLIKRYLRDDIAVVELGSSIGGVSSIISSKTKQKIYNIEANPFLIPTLSRNLNANQNQSGYKLIEAAIGYNSDESVAHFQRSTLSIGGRVLEKASDTSLAVPITTLSQIIKENGIDSYVLVSDIEGMETQLFTEEPESLDNCQQIIIELHKAYYKGKNYNINDNMRLIQSIGFKIIAKYGHVYCFDKLEK